MKPTRDELTDVFHPGYVTGRGRHSNAATNLREEDYKRAHQRWPELVRRGFIRFRGGLTKLTRRGWRALCFLQWGVWRP